MAGFRRGKALNHRWAKKKDELGVKKGIVKRGSGQKCYCSAGTHT